MTSLVDKTLEGVFLVSLKNKNIVYANDKLETMFGYEQGELNHKALSLLNVPIDHLYNSHEKFFEAEFIRKDKTTFWGRSHTVKFDHAQFGMVWLCVLEDISLKKERGERGKEFLIQNAIDKLKSEIASNLHDDMGQLLTVLKMDLHHLKEQPSKDFTTGMTRIEQTVDELVKRVRTIADELMPTKLLSYGVDKGIRLLVDDLNSRGRKTIQLKMSSLPVIKAESAAHFFRILQEALTNSIRHSNSQSITVDIEHTKGRIFLHVRDYDEGAKIDPEVLQSSMGISVMKERAGLLGGTFALFCDGGVHLKVDFPLKADL